MKTFAVIKNETVIKCILSASQQQADQSLEEGETCVEYSNVTPGWTYSNGTFSAPAQ